MRLGKQTKFVKKQQTACTTWRLINDLINTTPKRGRFLPHFLLGSNHAKILECHECD